MALDSARSMKKILRFLFGLFINVCILFILVKAFSYSYDFAYQVFATRAADPGSNRKATIQITQDEPLLDVADSLKMAEVIKDKYAFILKVRIGGYADDIQPGTYQIAPADGVYLFTAAGESYAAVYISDGSVTRWERRGALQSGSPAVAGMELKKGQTAYVRLQYMTRDYRYSVSVSRPAPDVSVSDEGVRISYDPECTGLHLIALYDTDGRMVDAQSVSVQSLDMHISVVLRGTQTGFVRVFQLAAETNTPCTAAKQIALPAA